MLAKNSIKHFVLATLCLFGTFTVASCSDGKIDYLSKCRLDASLNYKAGNFLDNGLGQVTLKSKIDGDTAHFYQMNDSKSEKGRVVKVRFIGIDTPESTGKIEPFGKKASRFTGSKLDSAKTIVLSSDIPEIGQSAKADSTGTRFKGFVWVSEKENCPVNELNLLNLWIVQEGYSASKGMSGSPFEQTFMDADMQAQKLQIGRYDPKGDDEYYAGAPTITTIKEMIDLVVEGDEESWEGAKVRFNGVVYKVVGDDAYVCDYFDDPDSGKQKIYGIFIFAGYKSYAPLKTAGNKIQVTGNFAMRFGNPQITNVNYNPAFPADDDLKILSRDNPITIEEKTIEEALKSKDRINTIVKISGLTATGGYDEKDSTTGKLSGAMTVYSKDANGKTIDVRIPADTWAINPETGNRITSYKEFMGENILSYAMTGAIELYKYEDFPEKYQLKLCHKDDLVFTLKTPE